VELLVLQIEEDAEVLGGLICRERSGSGVEDGSMKIPSKGIFINQNGSFFFFLCLIQLYTKETKEIETISQVGL
jgi:hypothetical protein